MIASFRSLCFVLLVLLGASFAQAQSELRFFAKESLAGPQSADRYVHFVRVRSMVQKGEHRQIYNSCSMTKEEFLKTGGMAPEIDCHVIGEPQGYTEAQLANLLDRTIGRRLGPDWHALRVNLSTAGISTLAAVVFFIVEPTKLLSSAMAGLAAMNYASSINEWSNENVFEDEAASMLGLVARSGQVGVVAVEKDLLKCERLLAIALDRVDERQPAHEPAVRPVRDVGGDAFLVYP